MTWQMDASESNHFELKARRRSDVYDRDPFEDDVKELDENGEFEDEEEEDPEEDEDEDELEDEDEFDDDDDDLEEDEEEEKDDL